MIFYKHFLGDYSHKTKHLSLLEHGAYRLLLDHYYSTQSPLSPTPELWYRLTQAVTPEEQEAVRRVVAEFFVRQDDDLLHNSRADQECSAWQKKAEFNRQIGHLGGRPKTHPLTQKEPKPEPEVRIKKDLKAKPMLRLRPNERVNQAQAVLTYLNRAAGRNFQARNPAGALTPNAEVILHRLEEGYTLAQLREVVFEKCQEWLNDERMASYLRPQTLFGKQKFAQYVGDLSTKPAQAVNGHDLLSEEPER